MRVSKYEDLVCWQLSNDLKIAVYALIDNSPARHDFKFCGQLKDSAASGPANLCEAFAYYRHKEAARLARIGRASLIETHNHLGDGIDRRHWTRETAAPLLHLANRAIGATTAWLLYLSSSEAP